MCHPDGVTSVETADELTMGQRLDRLRVQLGINPVVLTRRVGISRQHWYDIRNGKTRPSQPVLIALAVVLRVDHVPLLEAAGYPTT